MNRQPTPDIMGAILDAKPADALTPTTQVALSAVKNDGGTQMRAALNTDTILEYETTLRESDGWPFPPVILFYDGDGYWLADGFHRVSAAHRVPLATIPADVRAGTRRDAVLFAAGANASHGLRRTNADKRRAVETLLRDEEWAKWSNEEIARRCQVSANFVGDMRKNLATLIGLESPATRVGADGRVYNTENIGTKAPVKRLFVNELHGIVVGWVSQHWQREWPENPAHTNGTFWQELTAWLHQNRTETWNEVDLKTAIKEAHASRSVLLDPHEMSGRQIEAELDKARTTGWSLYTRWNADKKFVLRLVQVAAQLATAEHRNDTDLLIALRAKQYSKTDFDDWRRNQNPGTPPAPTAESEPQPAPKSDWQSVRTGIPADLARLGDVQWHPGQGWRIVATDGEIHGPDLLSLSGCLRMLRQLQAAANQAAQSDLPTYALDAVAVEDSTAWPDVAPEPLPAWAVQVADDADDVAPAAPPPIAAALQAVGATWELVITPRTDPAALGADLRDLVTADWMEALWNAYMGAAA